MNFAGKNYRLRDLAKDYYSARQRLVEEAMKKLTSERARFALKVLSVDEPIKYLEAVVRNDIALADRKDGDLVAVNHWDMDDEEKTKNLVFDPPK